MPNSALALFSCRPSRGLMKVRHAAATAAAAQMLAQIDGRAVRAKPFKEHEQALRARQKLLECLSVTAMKNRYALAVFPLLSYRICKGLAAGILRRKVAIRGIGAGRKCHYSMSPPRD